MIYRDCILQFRKFYNIRRMRSYGTFRKNFFELFEIFFNSKCCYTNSNVNFENI